MQELITALIKARQQFQPIRKDKANPFLKNKYATLDSVLEAVETALAAHGLTIVQTTDLVSIGEGSLPMQVLKTALYHESGQCITGSYQLPATDNQQKMGAAITYARRYGICAILNVTADADDDGNSNSGSKPAAVNPTVKKSPAARMVSTKRAGTPRENLPKTIAPSPN